jgi:heme-degrading monooxygenase HmoA
LLGNDSYSESEVMIIRSWKAMALEKNVEAYARHFSGSVLPELRRIPGHKGAYVLKKNEGGGVELVVLTLWDTMDAIRGFAGKNADQAVVDPAAEAVLESFDRTVQHFEVVLASAGTAASDG